MSFLPRRIISKVKCFSLKKCQCYDQKLLAPFWESKTRARVLPLGYCLNKTNSYWWKWILWSIIFILFELWRWLWFPSSCINSFAEKNFCVNLYFSFLHDTLQYASGTAEAAIVYSTYVMPWKKYFSFLVWCAIKNCSESRLLARLLSCTSNKIRNWSHTGYHHIRDL